MTSIIYKYDEEKEKILLQEIDKFLKADEPKTYNQFQKKRNDKIDQIEYDFQKFLIKRKREISLKDAKKIIKEKVLPKLSNIQDDILINKETHITHMKALRKYSEFQKNDLENFKNDNYEIKKEVLDLRAQIQLLKVELNKARALASHTHPLNRQIVTAAKNEGENLTNNPNK